MKFLTELLPGCFLIQPTKLEDRRGYFVKTYHEELFTQRGINMKIREEFYSVSRKDVLRGMHFQLPPHACEKLVSCPQGAVRDVLLDLRSGDGYGKVASTELSGENGNIVFIPKGVAHGFISLRDQSLMMYKTSEVHCPTCDCGIHWDSFGFDWGINQPCLSDRDQKHDFFNNFKTRF